jgi:hypothetical protein
MVNAANNTMRNNIIDSKHKSYTINNFMNINRDQDYKAVECNVTVISLK